MEIIEWFKRKLNHETWDIQEENGFVSMSAWQFALLISQYKEAKNEAKTYFVLFVLVAIFAVFYALIYHR